MLRVHRLALKEGPGYFRSSRDVEIGWGRYSINCIAWLGEALRANASVQQQRQGLWMKAGLFLFMSILR